MKIRNILLGIAATYFVFFATYNEIIKTPKGMAAWLGIRQAIAQSFQIGPGATIVGKLFRSGPPPTIAGLGSPSMTAGSTDYMGQFTAGNVNAVHTLTFSSAWTVTPNCWAISQGGNSIGLAYTPSTTAIVFSGVGIAAGAIINYGCTSSF